jgi:hypothetical protein
VELVEQLKVSESLIKTYKHDWTLQYGRTYQEWVYEKAKRLKNVLTYFYSKQKPIDVEYLISSVYRERLENVRLILWKPVKKQLTNHKPSPFIKSFINYLLDRLIEDGYLFHGWIVELHDRMRVKDVDIPFETKTFRTYSFGLFHKIVEIHDKLTIKDVKIEYEPTPIKIQRYPKLVIVELRERIGISDIEKPLEYGVQPKETTIDFEERLREIPSLEYLVDISTWKDS